MNQFACFVGLLVVMMSVSLMAIVAEGNTSDEINYLTLNNTSLTNISTNNGSASNPIKDTANLTAPDGSNPKSNVSINVTAGPSQPVFAASIGPAFTIGTGLKDNSSAYRLGGKVQTVKNLSAMGYIIQGTPHGYT